MFGFTTGAGVITAGGITGGGKSGSNAMSPFLQLTKKITKNKAKKVLKD